MARECVLSACVVIALMSVDPAVVAAQWLKITHETAFREQVFGYRVETLGNLLLVSAVGNRDAGTGTGTVMVYDLADPEFRHVFTIEPTMEPNTRQFGGELQVDGNRVLISEKFGDGIYYYELVGDTFIERQILKPPDLVDGQVLDVQLLGDWAIASMYRAEFTDGSRSEWYDVFAFRYIKNKWVFQQEIEAPIVIDGLGLSPTVCLTNSYLAIPVRGDQSVFFYELVNDEWIYDWTLESDEARPFGYGFTCTEEDLLVQRRGKRMIDIYSKDSGQWNQSPSTVSLPSDSVGSSHFNLMEMEAGYLFVETYTRLSESRISTGVLNIFGKEDGKWSSKNVIMSPDPSDDDGFGWSVALTDELIIVGSPWEDSGLEDPDERSLDENGAVFIARRDVFLPIEQKVVETPDINRFRPAYPNPSQQTATIEYEVTDSAPVSISLYDALGRQVSTIVNDYKVAGSHSNQIDVSLIPNGVYFYRIQIGRFSATKPLTVIH